MKKMRVFISFLLGLVIYLQQGSVRADPDFLVEAAELKASMDGGKIVILDARNASSYAEGHIQGAINAWWEDLAEISGTPKDPDYGVLLSKEKLGKILGGFGIDTATKVVVYADSKNGWGEDGRAVWMLRMAGVMDSRMLNGGIQAWTAKGYSTTKTVPKPTPKSFIISAFDSEWTADTAWIEKNKAGIKLVDTRTKQEYDGAILYGEARGGHIPSATFIPFKSLFASDGKLKPKTALEKLFKDAGLKKTDPIVPYCTGGIRSAHMTLILRMIGFNNTRNYDASFWGWSADTRLPVEKI